MQQDIAFGRAGKPQKLEELDLDQILLVDTFGVWERHGGSDWKVRLINNFRRNRVNEFSWVPAKLQQNGYSDLREAAAIFREHSTVALELGKADFKSALKTLPPSSSQDWLCQSLVFDPRERCHKVVSLRSQAFGSVGAVVAWFRTASAIQAILEHLFGVVTLMYVDDCFWFGSKADDAFSLPTSLWQREVLSFVVTELLGWE